MGSSVKNLTVSLEHDIDEQYQYTPGEIVRGKVSFDVTQKFDLRKIYITVHGEGVVAWEDNVYGSFTSQEEYINMSHTVEDRTNSTPLPVDRGYHEFPFEYQLPENLPSSFIGKFGSVTYVLKANVNGDRPGETSITSEPFLVLRRIRLPDQCKYSVSETKEKRLWKMFSSGKVKLTAQVNRLGGTQGEDLFIQAEVANKSPVRVTALQASIVMNSLYIAQKRAIPYRQIVNKRRDEYELVRGDGRRWQNVRLSIPPYIPETKLENCDIIEISYILQFRVETAGGKEIVIEFPFFVGSHDGSEELPINKKQEFVNRQWNLTSKEFQMDGQEPLPDYEGANHEWTGGTVPELRNPDSKVINPLFETHDKPNITSKDIDHFNPTLEELPEVIEKTKL